MKSMLTPSLAASVASTPNACAEIGRPSTTMVWVDGSMITGMSSLGSIETSSPTPWIAASISPWKPGSAITSTVRHQH